MEEPTNIGQLHSFLGMVTYYRDMWPRRSHILAPLTELIGTKTFKWDEPQRKAFREMKALIAKDTLLAYPDHNLPFKIETNASDYQLGGHIYQEQWCDETKKHVPRDIAFCSRKVSGAQKNYSTIEKELCSIVETLKAFWDTVFGGKIEIYTDHKNLTYKLSQFSMQQIIHWRLLIEDYKVFQATLRRFRANLFPPEWHQNGDDKIVLTQELLPKVVKYYHEAMAHAKGSGRLSHTIKRHFYHKDIDKVVKKHIEECTTCVLTKHGEKTYSESGPRDAFVLPWQQVHCDSIGNWEVPLRARTLKFHAMTMIDACTNLVEIWYTKTATAAEGAAAVENTWLAQYPKPVRIISDQGPEFGQEFTNMCNRNGITHKTSTSRNPQGNSLIESIHKTIAQVLRVVTAAKNPKSIHEGQQVIHKTLATAMHACRCACSSSLGYNSPGALAFNRDMFLDIPLYADILAIRNNRRLLVDKRLIHENAKHIRHDYAVRDIIWKKNYLRFSDKLMPTVSGPYPIDRVHTNGTVTIRLSPNQTERINIRRICPKFPLSSSSQAELSHGKGE
jgi:transposase InsO family protein